MKVAEGLRQTIVIAIFLLAVWPGPTSAKVAPNEALLKLLPNELGPFKATNPVTGVTATDAKADDRTANLRRTYQSAAGGRYEIALSTTVSESEAFALLTEARLKTEGSNALKFDHIGTAHFGTNSTVSFFKGNAFVSVGVDTKGTPDELVSLARALAQTLNAGSGEIPVLVKHLPDWAKASQRAVFCVSLVALQHAVRIPADERRGLEIYQGVQPQPLLNEPQRVLDVVNFEGGAEAVVATYDQAKLAIVEFTTPQLSVDNDQRIWTKIGELKSQGQTVPSAYRRVGNYSVFVFNAPDEKTANGLIDQVKYEQVVQWLGDDPYLHERLQRYFAETSAGVLIAVLKSSGLSLLFCLAAGAFIGALLFRHRRAQRAAVFSDAGGSVRLNLDDLTSPSQSRLLKGGASSDSPNP